MAIPTRRCRLLFVCLAAALVWGLSASPRAAEPLRYRLSFPEPEHHVMQVEATFPDAGGAPLELRMSQSSPGRYSLHNFSKNVFDVHAFGADGREIETTRPDPFGWTVPAHGPVVTIRYRVFGDFLDGTYLAFDGTHAHINMPAAILWARGMDDRPATIVLEPPAGRRWQAATQLHAGDAPLTFTAPNLQYLMDSPIEFGAISVREVPTGGPAVRVAMHHTGTDADLDAFAGDLARVVRVEGAIFGEFPAYEPGRYTFIVDSLPDAIPDGMEHRNSTVITSRSTIQGDRQDLLWSAAHEFFHGWNVERIRPRSIEPFDLTRANMSDELWLAEGFTEYYGAIALRRAGLTSLGQTLETFKRFVTSVTLAPSRGRRSAVDMSRLAVFSDRDVPEDRTNMADTFVSYYDYGGALALALDLELRQRTGGRLSLDDYMRELWRVHGRPGGGRQGYVDHPYTMADAEARLADVAGDAAFARDFFARFVTGHDVPDFERLPGSAGLSLHPASPARAWLGDLRLSARASGLHLVQAPASNTPAFAAGLDVDDELQTLDGTRVTTPLAVDNVLDRHKPGDRIEVTFRSREGARRATVTVAANPEWELLPSEEQGDVLTPAQRAVRDRWLGTM